MLQGGAIEVPTAFTTFDEYWRPFLLGTGPAPSYVASLTEAGRAALRDALFRRLSASDGSIALQAGLGRSRHRGLTVASAITRQISSSIRRNSTRAATGPGLPAPIRKPGQLSHEPPAVPGATVEVDQLLETAIRADHRPGPVSGSR
ncbi:MAG: hypothetical protein R2882_06820 [Gemmatimonadales bacterium]